MTRNVVVGVAALACVLCLAPAGLAAVEETPGDAGYIITGSRTEAGFGIVRIRADENPLDGKYEKVVGDFFPYGDKKVGEGVRVAAGDLNGDGIDELIVAAGNNLPVRVYQLGTDGQLGGLIESKSVFGKRGAYIATGDVNNDGREDLIVGVGTGSPALVRIFSDTDSDGKVLDNQTDSFTAFPNFKGGVTVAAGNTDNLGGAEVIAGMASNGRRIVVRTDADADRAVSDQPAIETLKPYTAAFKGGVNLSSGAVENTGGNGFDLFVSPAKGKGKVLLYTDSNVSGKLGDNPLAESFYAYGSSWAKGVRTVTGDTDHSGFFAELVTTPAASSNKQSTKIWDDTGDVGAFLSDNARTQTFKGMPTSVKTAGTWAAFAVVNTTPYVFPGFPQTIGDNATLNSEFWVPASAGIIRDLDVGLNIFHSFDGDLDVTLTHVSTGTSLILFQDVGGTNEGFLVRLTDEAGTDITAATNPKLDGAISGTFNPAGAALLSAFDGQDASGLWRLTIVDDSAGDNGTLFGWTLFVTN